MRIHDLKSDKSISEVCVFLNIEEAKEMRDYLASLIKDFEQGDTSAHAHINDSTFAVTNSQPFLEKRG
jgi:hypothetical protein